jgi:hypothetical protein
MSPVVSNNASVSSNPVQSVRPVEPRGRNDQNAGGAAPAGTDATASPSAVVTINPVARERAQAERMSASGANGAAPTESSTTARTNAQANRPAGPVAAAVNGNRVPTNVSAALRAYESAQSTAAAAPSQTPRNQPTQESRSTSAANDPTGLNNVGRTRPPRAGEPETANTAEQAQERQQRDQAALLQSAAANTARAGNQSARVG